MFVDTTAYSSTLQWEIMSVWNVFVSQNIRKLIVFLRVFLDVDFSNDVPPPSVCIVVQAAGFD